MNAADLLQTLEWTHLLPSGFDAPRTGIGDAIAPDPGLVHGASNAATEEPGIDMLLVEVGARPLALIHGPERQLEALGAWARMRGLVAWLSAHEFSPVRDPSRAGYSNVGQNWQRARTDSGAWRGLLVGPGAEQVALAWLAMQAGWDEMLGVMLGYPPCCAKAYEKRWPIARRSHDGDPGAMLMEASPNGAVHPWRLNVHARYLGTSLVDWFPCTFECSRSLAVARRIERGLRIVAPEVLTGMRERMCTTVLRLAGEGTLFVRSHAGVRQVLPAHADGAAAQSLRQGAAIRALGDAGVSIDGFVYSGRMSEFSEDHPGVMQ